MEKSSYSNFPAAVLIYSGPNTMLFHDGGVGIRYYRVRACNSNGCSGYSNVVTGRVLLACL